MAKLSAAQVDAAQEFLAATLDRIATAEGIHAETAVAATARMAGSFLFRSFGFGLEGIAPGQVVLSDRANEEGPPLLQILAGVLGHTGVVLDPERLAKGPDPERRPLLSFLETQARLELRYAAIQERTGLSHAEAADAAAAAAAFLIMQCAGTLDPNTAFAIAVEGLVEGAKTAPGPPAP